jgi:hypothetical protein
LLSLRVETVKGVKACASFSFSNKKEVNSHMVSGMHLSACISM